MTLALWMMGYAGAVSTLFVIVYHCLARWWETGMGINAMSLVASLAVTLDLALWVNLADVTWPGLVYVAAFLYFAIGSIVLWRLAIVVHVQRPPKATAPTPQ